MAERNYKHEYETRKKRIDQIGKKTKLIGTEVSFEIFEEFTAKCEAQNTTKNAIIKQWIEAYIKGDLW